MGWRTTCVEDQRKLFIDCFFEGQGNLSDLCQSFGISRPTAYKWIERFQKFGYKGLCDQRRTRLTQIRTNENLVQQILTVKNQYEKWGPKKILGYLENLHPDKEWPSPSTIDNILLRNGYERSRKSRRKFPAKEGPLCTSNSPNDIWSIDFKGWFKTKDAFKCDPFTISDS